MKFSQVLVKVSDVISPTLSNIFNRCILRSVYPHILKRTCILQILKSGDPNFASNYSPIYCSLYAVSLTSLLNILYIDDLEILSWHAVFLILMRGFRFTHFISSCPIGLIRIKLSTWNRLTGGCNSLCVAFLYNSVLPTHIQLFCYVADAYSTSFQRKSFITFCFVGHIAWNTVHKRTKQ